MADTILAGRYQIVEPLGSGGFGKTFKAKDLHLPGYPLCVVKKLQIQTHDPRELAIAKRLFDNEATILYKMGCHTQIPQLLAHFEQDGELYLVQELICGQPLNLEILPGRPLNESYVLSLLQDVLEVLAYVHGQGVIHRDLKPANLIRRSQDRKIVLIDFGAVKEVSNQATSISGQTQLTIAIGSPGYMPMEQIMGKPRLSSDIYALGIITLVALTGIPPQQLPHDLRTGEYSCATCLRHKSINPGLAAIIDRMVHDSLSLRYKNAKQVLEDLDALGTKSTIAQPPSLSQQEISTVFTAKTKVMNNASSSATEVITPIDPAFLHRCQQELACCIGPFAQFMIDDILAQQPQINRQQLIAALASEIPNPTEAEDFMRKLS